MALTKTVPLVMLLNELNRLKEASGVKDVAAADHLGCAASKINRILLGTSKVTPGDGNLRVQHGIRGIARLRPIGQGAMPLS